jgi:hypothetical protein
MRMIWYGMPFVFSPAHAGTDYVSTHRVLTFERMSREVVTAMGVPIADGSMVTQSMWEAAYDGLHYLRGSNDNWNGHISSVVTQVILNTIFGKCGADTGAATTPATPAPPAVTPVSTDTTTSPEPVTDVTPPAAPYDPFSCTIPASPFAVPDAVIAPTDAHSKSKDGLTVDFPDMFMCTMRTLRITPPAALLAKVVAGEAIEAQGLTAHMVTWDGAQKTDDRHFPLPCIPINGSVSAAHCARFERQLVLYLSDDGTAIVTQFMPDPSVHHYVLRVTLNGACITSNVLTTVLPNRNGQHCPIPYVIGREGKVYRGRGDECEAVLHQYVESSGDTVAHSLPTYPRIPTAMVAFISLKI